MSILTKDAEGKRVSLEFTVPLLAPSVNHYKNSRHHVGGEAKAFYEAVVLFARGEYVRFRWYAIEIWVTLGPKQKGDLDNFGKVCLDALVKAGVIHSDAKVSCLVLRKHRGETESTQFCVTEGAKP